MDHTLISDDRTLLNAQNNFLMDFLQTFKLE